MPRSPRDGDSDGKSGRRHSLEDERALSKDELLRWLSSIAELELVPQLQQNGSGVQSYALDDLMSGEIALRLLAQLHPEVFCPHAAETAWAASSSFPGPPFANGAKHDKTGVSLTLSQASRSGSAPPDADRRQKRLDPTLGTMGARSNCGSCNRGETVPLCRIARAPTDGRSTSTRVQSLYYRNYKLLQRVLFLIGVEQEPCDWTELANGRTSEQLHLLRWLREYYIAAKRETNIDMVGAHQSYHRGVLTDDAISPPVPADGDVAIQLLWNKRSRYKGQLHTFSTVASASKVRLPSRDTTVDRHSPACSSPGPLPDSLQFRHSSGSLSPTGPFASSFGGGMESPSSLYLARTLFL